MYVFRIMIDEFWIPLPDMEFSVGSVLAFWASGAGASVRSRDLVFIKILDWQLVFFT